MRSTLGGCSIYHMLIDVAILFLFTSFTSRVYYSLAVEINDGYASHFPSSPTNSIASTGPGFQHLPDDILQHIATMPKMKFADVALFGATDKRIRQLMLDFLPIDRRDLMPILNELCHFNSRKSTAKLISCRLPDIDRGIDNILPLMRSSDKIRLQLRALNHLLEGKSNQINLNIEGHREDDNKATYLMLAAEDGLLYVVKLLLELHADVHPKDDYALRWASYNGHWKVVKLLLEHGADVHADDDSALRWASNKGYWKVVKLLLEHDADVHANDDSALEMADMHGHRKVVKLLLQHGANIRKLIFLKKFYLPRHPFNNNNRKLGRFS